jgi:hypothetical protein
MLTATKSTVDTELYLADMRVAEECRAILEAAQIAYNRALFKVQLHEQNISSDGLRSDDWQNADEYLTIAVGNTGNIMD